MGETVVLRGVEQQRLVVLNRVLMGDLTAAEAAAVLERSVRQVRRLLAAYRKEGAAALVHGNRGRTPTHALDAALAAQVLTLIQTTYAGCNDTLVSELLAERDGLTLSRHSVRRLRQRAGLARSRTRRLPARRRRERKAQAGMLLQLDGSRHAWLEERGPWLTLLAAIDDATGTIPAAVFRTQEDAAGYLALVHQTVCTVGVPEAVYHDRHGIFLRPSRAPQSLAEQLAGEREPTQVGRALRDLGIVSIAAHSPQAKGRIERLFGTLQDRLVAELRLAGASTPEEANTVLATYLPRFNARFAVPAASPDSAWRSLPPELDPWQICCFRYTRTVGRDDTVRLGAYRLQLLPPRDHGTYARCRVDIHEHLDGSLSVWHQGQVIASRPAPVEAPVLRARHGRSTTPLASDASLASGVVADGSAAVSSPAPCAGRRSPSPTHPWRSGFTKRG
ncbi:MAG: ISNCY family transposase [Solirubrobacteraceae bacterium]